MSEDTNLKRAIESAAKLVLSDASAPESLHLATFVVSVLLSDKPNGTQGC